VNYSRKTAGSNDFLVMPIYRSHKRQELIGLSQLN
jgi:hypothetical protein